MTTQTQIACASCGKRPVPLPTDICYKCGKTMKAAQTAISIEELLDAGGATEMMEFMSPSGHRRMVTEMRNRQELS